MNKFLVETLKPLSIPCFFIQKPQSFVGDYIAFNYSDEGLAYSNNKREITLFQATVNIISNDLKRGLELKKQVMQLLSEKEIDARGVPTFYDGDTQSYVFILEFDYLM